MTGQQLKNSILQLAIQGKLVPQDPNDEPASVLLQRIRKEKEQLVKEGKLKKKDLISEPIAEDEKPFDIPESWEWCRLGEVLIDSGAGKSPDCEKRPRKGEEWGVITTTSIQDGWFDAGANKVLPSNFIIQEDQVVHKGDFLITRAGPRNRTGIMCVVKEQPCHLILSDKTVRLEYCKGYVDPTYLLFYFRCFEGRLEVEKYMVGMAASQVNISQNNMKMFVLPLPPLSEQQRIVAKIEELMPLVEDYDKAQKELNDLNEKLPEQLKKSILQQAIMGKLVPQDPADEPASVLLQRIRKEKEQLVKEGKLKKKDLETTPIADDEKPFELPEGWEWCRMRDLCNFANPNKKEAKLVCLDTCYLRGKGEGSIMSKGNYVDKGQYIILVDGENSGEVFITPSEGFLGSTFKELLITNEESFDFLKYIFLIIKEELRRNKRGAAIPHLDKVLFFEHLIPLPPLPEQHRIVAKIEELFALLEKK